MGPWPRDADYEKAALSAAITAKLVPETDYIRAPSSRKSRRMICTS
jgi:hypothetical protein